MELDRLIKEVQSRENVELLLLEAGGYRAPGVAGLSEDDRSDAVQWLAQHNLITVVLSGAFHLDHDARLLSKRLDESRTRGERRWDLVTKAMLQAINRNDDLEADMTVDGLPVTDDERRVVYDRIERWELATLIREMSLKVVRVVPKPRLLEALQVSGFLKEYYEGRMYADQRINSHHITISDSTIGGIMSGGSGNTMYIEQTLSAEEAASVKEKLKSILQGLDGVDGAEELASIVQKTLSQIDAPGATKTSIKNKILEAMDVAGNLSSVVQSTPTIGTLISSFVQLLSVL